MKKSNYIVYGIALVASALLLFLWNHFEFNKLDGPLDILVNALWWGIVAASIFLIMRAEKQRREQVRTIYVSPTALFNSERGLVECSPSERIACMSDILSGLSYGMRSEDMPAENTFDCKYVVRTSDFSTNSAHAAWRGSVVRVDKIRGNSIHDFESAAELQNALN